MKHLAIDIGAESGRAVLGWLEEGIMRTEEVHRFPNIPLDIEGSLRWDVEALLAGVHEGIAQAGPELGSIGIDTWGVDYALVDSAGELVSKPYHYRDSRTTGALERVSDKVPAWELYDRTGIQLMPFNTLFQLVASNPDDLNRAQSLLTIPDFLNFRLTGARRAEFTNSTTTQCFDPRTGDWSWGLLKQLQIPTHLFPGIVQPGSHLGKVGNVSVVAVASHDTAAAVAGTPIGERHAAWVSSGTWSILGVEVPEPILCEAGFQANFSNEGGYDNTYRFCKNVMGLWIIQQCRAAWDTYSYGELTELAACAEPDFGVIDPDDPVFFKPGNMPNRINRYLRDTNQRSTEDPGQLVRIVIEGLARKYRQLLSGLEAITGSEFEILHIVGGGSQNQLLNQITANKCRIPVIAGPVEAAAIGNLVVQMIAHGEVNSLAEARKMILRSFPMERFDPC